MNEKNKNNMNKKNKNNMNEKNNNRRAKIGGTI